MPPTPRRDGADSVRRAALLAAVLGAAVHGGCGGSILVTRVSNEFDCPPQRISIVDREDIAANLYDVNACGSRARYMCFVTDDVAGCTREPDPPRWNPNPALLESLPGPFRADNGVRSARVCPRSRSVEPNDCLQFKDGAWSWLHRDGPGIMGGAPHFH